VSPRAKPARATLSSLRSVFTVPESPDSTLARVEREISENLTGFLQEHIVAVEHDLAALERRLMESTIPEQPTFVSDHAHFLLDHIVPHSVHTASPRFVGHMTSAVPYFMLSLSKIMIALNQNLVNTETSKVFTPLERQVIGMLHRLVYERDDDFYARTMHDATQPLGAFGSGGTVANITALWVARNRAFPQADGFAGVAEAGLHRALRHYGYEGAAIVVSERGHYSLAKSADVLGLGRSELVSVRTDDDNRIDLGELRRKCAALKAEGIKTMAIVGIAGNTETGSVDPLIEMADLCEELGCHFHVDAAWAGPALMSKRHRHLLRGIDRADSVTLDAHKQLYVPMGAGLLVFKDPEAARSILHHARYIIRPGSKDLGAATLEGSRPGMALLVHSALRIFGREGYGLLIDRGIDRARDFAKMLSNDAHFQLVTAPETNILTYRLLPPDIASAWNQLAPAEQDEVQPLLNEFTVELQKTQRTRGKSFVSRTTLTPAVTGRRPTVVLRVVLANPLTTNLILREILDEQKALAQQGSPAQALARVRQRMGLAEH
jgi:glutamate decarboxylase